MQAKRGLFDKEDTYSLRGLCMLAIIGHHLYQWTESRYGVNYPIPIGLIFGNAGYLGSALFFLISGYGASLSIWKNKQTAAGTINRLSKLYLPFVFYWLIGSIILLTEGNGFRTISWTGLITLDLPVSGGGKWFIVSIIVLYILSIFLSLFIKNRKQIAIVLLFIVVGYIVLQIQLNSVSSTWYNSILAFPVGVTCVAWRDNLDRFNSSKIGVLFLVLFFVCFFLSLICGTTHYWPTENDGVYRAFFQNLASTLLALYAIRLISVINIRNDKLNYIGVNSLSIFLAHQVLVTSSDKIFDVYTYSFYVIAGTFALTWLYNITLKRII